MRRRTKPLPICACGCGEFTEMRTHKFIVGHIFRTRKRMEDLYKVDQSTGCWEWQGIKLPKGYGRRTIRGITICAHRYFWEKYNGRKIKKGMHIDHLCKNTSCVNPEHLEEVTPIENFHRSNAVVKLDFIKAKEIRKLYFEGANKKQLAKMFNVSYGIIRDVVINITWKTS